MNSLVLLVLSIGHCLVIFAESFTSISREVVDEAGTADIEYSLTRTHHLSIDDARNITKIAQIVLN